MGTLRASTWHTNALHAIGLSHACLGTAALGLVKSVWVDAWRRFTANGVLDPMLAEEGEKRRLPLEQLDSLPKRRAKSNLHLYSNVIGREPECKTLQAVEEDLPIERHNIIWNVRIEDLGSCSAAHFSTGVAPRGTAEERESAAC